ncbi:MAG: 3-coathanger stack domain-containing protein, partial [Thermoanaerobaculia bacterium]
ALTFGTDHPYGFQPKRVPDRMKTHVASRAASNVGCFNPLLTITKHGTGTGTVTSDDGGIDCGIECTEPYPPGAVVVALTAAEDANSTFNGWSGDPDCSDGVVTMSSSKTCTATFNLVPRLLTIAKAEGGTVVSSPVGIDCGIDCQESYLHGSAVSLAAVPDIGWMVGGWSGDADCSDGHLTMNDDRTCSMTFEICSPSQLDVPDQNVSTPVPEPFAACNIVTAAAFRVLEGGEVTFRAGNTIILKDGFEVHSGASFRAIIGPPSS